MKLATFQEILDVIHTYGSRESLKYVSTIHPELSQKTLGSIYSQDYQRKMKKTHYKHYNPDRMDQYYRKYCTRSKKDHSRDLVLKMAEEIDLSPSFLARILVERYLMYTKFDGNPPPKTVVTQVLKDTTQLDNPVLAIQVDTCIVADENYGPYVDTIKHTIGHEYECLLKAKLQERGLAFQDEDYMRAKGYDKTPDTKLEVPIAVDGLVVNWIESKASFGDEESHRNYLKDQYWSYWNRTEPANLPSAYTGPAGGTAGWGTKAMINKPWFGPGLVIYWFGFIDELDINREKGIVLMDHFPDNIVTMDPLSLLPPSS